MDTINLNQRMNSELEELLRRGWLRRLAKLICAKLFLRAAREGWTKERFHTEVIREVRAWLMQTFQITCNDFADDVMREFCILMAAKRLDLFYDRRKGNRRAYLYGILRNLVRKVRQERKLARRKCIPLTEVVGRAHQSSPLEQLIEEEHQQIVAKQTAEALAHIRTHFAPHQLVDLGRQYGFEVGSGQEPVKSGTLYMRSWRKLEAIRKSLIQAGIMAALPSAGPRHRAPRSRRRSRSRRGKNRLRGPQSCVILLEKELQVTQRKQAELDAENARALKTLFASLPASYRARADAVLQVKEIFESELAKRLPHSRRIQTMEHDGESSSA